eukprot:6208944-Pleurochrysis_carterae.AAC.1
MVRVPQQEGHSYAIVISICLHIFTGYYRASSVISGARARVGGRGAKTCVQRRHSTRHTPARLARQNELLPRHVLGLCALTALRQVVLDKDGNVSPEGTSAVAAGCGIKQPCTAGVTSFELQDSYDRVVVNAAGEVDVMESKDETEFLAEGEQEEGSNEARKLHAMGLAKANWAALYSRVFGPQTSQAAAATGRAFESGQRRAATAAATAATATAEIAVEARKTGAGAGEVDSSSNLGVTADVWWERPLGADGSVPEPRDTAGTIDGAIGRPAPPGGSRAASGGGTAHRYERWRSEWSALRGRQLDLQNKPHLNTADRLGKGGAESVEALSGALSEQINYL